MITPERKKEIVDKTVQGLRAQGGYSLYRSLVTGIPVCRYRSGDGRKCAVGIHIPDDMYHADLEGEMVHSKVIVHALMASGISEYSERDVLYLLQGIHDDRAYHYVQSPFGTEAAHLEATLKMMEEI